PSQSASASPPVRITLFYTTAATAPKGESGLLCYGVEGTKSVWLDPPRGSYRLRCRDAWKLKPTETTSYALTAKDAGGTQELTVAMGAPRVKIVEIRVDSLEVPRGSPLQICYVVESNSLPIGVEIRR